MKRCEYKEIYTDVEVYLNGKVEKSWSPLVRQCLIGFGFWCNYFIQGLFFGATTVIVAQTRREANSTEAVTDEMLSWLSSMPVITSFPFLVILPWLLYHIGRKYTFLIVCLLTVMSSVILYTSTDLYQILYSQVFLGAGVASVNSVLPIVIAEYTSPKYRGIILTFKSASTFWGIWVANAIGTYFYWKNIALLTILCSVHLLIVFAWPESPYWLAMKGRYAECAKAHRWLKGVNEDAEKELAKLIKPQNNSNKTNEIDEFQYFSRFLRAWSTFKSRSFYKPTLLSTLMLLQYYFTGKFVISIYAIEVLKSLTQDESVAFKAMLILDGVTVFSMYAGCILSRYCKRRILLLSFTSISIWFLYIISLYSFLVSLDFIEKNHVIIILLLTFYSIAVCCGPMILASSIYGEIVPLRYQSSIMIISGFCSCSLSAILLKISPFMFKYLKMHGCFLLFAISSTVVITIQYIYLPETKDRTVYEIEQLLTGNKKTAERTKTLLDTKECNFT